MVEPMRRNREQRKTRAAGTVDTGIVVRGSGPVVTRGRVGGPVLRGGGAGLRYLGLIILLGVAYFVVGSFRHEIVAAYPGAFPILKAMGYEVTEPAGFGLRLTGAANRATDENGRWVVYVRGRVTNTLKDRRSVPRIVVAITSSNVPPMRYTIEPGLTSLAPGQSTDFSARYPTPFAARDIRLKLEFQR